MFKRIKLIEGSSISDKTIDKIKKMVTKNCRVIVWLDSNHTKNHVLKELQLYLGFVSLGG